jgi:hypothetical protein
MESTSAGDLVTLTGEGPQLDGIVFDAPSRTKIVVAVLDPARGPVFRTVHPKTLNERSEESPDDRALHLLIRRTPQPARGPLSGARSTGHGNAGHSRAAMHRTTGK